MADFIEVAKTSEMPSGKMKVVTVGGHEILLANGDGAIHAINRRCGHMNAPLENGVLKGKEVTCPMHGVRFDVSTGKKLSEPVMGAAPGMDKLPPEFLAYLGKIGQLIGKIATLDCQSYAVQVDGESVKVRSEEGRHTSTEPHTSGYKRGAPGAVLDRGNWQPLADVVPVCRVRLRTGSLPRIFGARSAPYWVVLKGQ